MPEDNYSYQGRESSQSNKSLKIPKINKKTLMVIIIALLLGLIILLTFITPRTKPPKPAADKPAKTYPFDTKPWDQGYKVGDITVTLDDLEETYGQYYRDTPEERQNKANWEFALEKVREDALIQTEAQKAGLTKESGTETTPQTQDSLDPKYIANAKEYLKTNKVSWISLERINIFFNNTINPNVINPKIGINAAKAKAWQILSGIRPKIVSGELSMKEAGDQLIAMKDLADVDLAWEQNAYDKYSMIMKSEIFFDPKLHEIAWGMEENEVSPILTSSEGGKENYYSIIKVTGKNIGEYESLDDLFKNNSPEKIVL